MTGRSRMRDRSRPAGGTPLSPPAITGTIYLIDNASAADGSLSSLSSRRPAPRALTVSGTASAQPRGVSRSYYHGGRPALLFSGSDLQYAQDQNADAATTIAPLTAAGSGFVARLALTGFGPILGNWGGATSNENAFSLEFSAGEVLTLYVTNRGGGGRILIGASTTAADVRVGDTVTITFLHQSNQTWTLKIVREPRDNETTTTTINLSGGPYGGTIDATTPLAGLTLGAYRGLATFGAAIIHNFIAFTIGASTATEVAAYEAWIASQCNVTRPAYTATDALQSADWNVADLIHPQDYTRVANVGRACEQAVVTALGLSGTVKVGVLGDSRAAGPDYLRTLGTNDLRALLQTGATFTRSAVGPIDDGSASATRFHFARSAYVTRGFGVQLGHSQATPTATTIDNYVGSGKSFNDVNVWTIWLGYNEPSGANATSLDWVYEYERLIRYLYTTQRALAGVTPGFALIGEPATYTTTTGPLQRRLRARNHQLRVMAARLAAEGYTIALGNINDWTRAT